MKILPNINSKLKLLLFVGLSSIYSCNSLNTNTNTTIEKKENELRYKKTQLVQAMLDLPELQQYFQVQETLKQKELVILKNSCVDGIDSILAFHLPIKFLHESEILNDSIKAFVEFKEINLKNDSAFVYYRYDVQGIGIESSYIYRNGKWNLIKHHLWEN
jgi:hypothetical protein